MIIFSRFVAFFLLSTIVLFTASAQTPSDSVTITFRTYKPSSPTLYVPGGFNNWGPNSSGVISSGAISQMTFDAATTSWVKTYTFKIHNSSDAQRTLGDSIYQYKFNQGGASTGWYSDPLNPETNSADNNNSILRLTKLFWFEPNLVSSGTQYTHLGAGLVHDNGATITSIILMTGLTSLTATSANIISSYNTSTRLLEYDFPSAIPKTYFVRLSAISSRGDSIVYYLAGLNITTAPLPAYANQGVTLPSAASNDSVTFAVRAPGRDYVKIRIAPLGQSPATVTGILMNQSPDGYTWWLNMKLAAGTYQYLYEMPDGTTLYDPWGRYNGANGSRFTIGAEGLTADDYVWHSTGWQRPPMNRLVIEEMNLQEVVGGYYNRSAGQENFKDLIALLPHYDSLGVNALELMPINDFGSVGQSGFSWGYDPNTDLALEPGYGTPRDLKTLVDSAHSRGIAIILDVVFNQLNGTGPLWQIAPQIGVNQYFKNASDTRPNEDPTSYFQDMDHWTTFTQEYIHTALKMWIDDYKIDGFRYDFTRGIGWDPAQPAKGVLGWANRIDTEYNGKIYQIAEHLPESPTLIHLSGLTSSWHGSFRSELFNEVDSQNTSLDNFENYILDLQAYNSPDVPNTQTSYDNRTNPVDLSVDHDELSPIYQMMQYGGVSQADALKRDNLYTTFIFMSLGIPMLWEGMEYGESRGWPDSGTRMSYRPVQWSLASTTNGQAHYQYYKKLIDQRLNNPALYQGRLRRLYKYYSQRSLVWGFEDTASTAKVMCVANLTGSSQTITGVPWLAAGTWYDIFDNSQYQASGTTIASFTIPAYTARVFTNILPGNAPQFQISTDTLRYGNVTWGMSQSLPVTITNTGGDSLIVSSISPSNPAFTPKNSAVRLAAGRTFVDSIRFTPAHTGADSALIVLSSNSAEHKDTVWVYGTGIPQVIAAPSLISPADQSDNQPLLTHFRWSNPAGATMYFLRVSVDSLFGSLTVNDSTLTDTVFTTALGLAETYYWQVQALNPYGASPWSAARRFSTVTLQFSVDVAVRPGWNMVSVPLAQDDMRPAALFPKCVSQAFDYESRYVQKDTLKQGTGYWLKSDSSRIYTFTGIPAWAETIGVKTGWNLIGTASAPVAVGGIGASVPGMITSNFFAYGTSYSSADSLHPGSGYWVKVNQDGRLIVSASSVSASFNRLSVMPTAEMPPAPPGEESVTGGPPAEFLLEQNYPNPFNPTTEVSFVIGSAALVRHDSPSGGGGSFVSLKVYDILGREVATLVNENKEPGAYTVYWDASNQPSGVYYCLLVAGEFTQVKRMLLVK
jgi:1,4-alpha-glucan branching enzyme